MLAKPALESLESICWLLQFQVLKELRTTQHYSLLSEPGVLGPAGVREARASVRTISRCMHVGLEASCRRPARCTPLHVAKFHATASPVGFRTMAVASPRGNAAHECRCVGQKRNRAGQQRNSQSDQPPEGTSAREGSAETSLHKGILGRMQEKTDSPGSS